MDIIEQTRQLGAAIQNSELYRQFSKARSANDSDSALQAQIEMFSTLREQLGQLLQQEKPDDQSVAGLNSDMRMLYSEIMTNENMQSYNAAKEAMDKMVSAVNAIITASVNGQDPMTCPTESGCGGSCGSCGGCG